MPRLSDRKQKIYKEIFYTCDTNQDGEISLKELKAFIRNNAKDHPLDDHQIGYIFSFGDRDNSKSLRYDEFVCILENPEFKYIFGKWMIRYVNFILPPHPVPKKTEYVSKVAVYSQSTEVQAVSFYQDGLTRSVSQASEIDVLIDEEEFSYTQAYTCDPPPLAMILFTAIELICFFTDVIINNEDGLSAAGVTAKIFIYEPNKRLQAWRFLSYMLVHFGYSHLIPNLLIQLCLGIPLEMVHKWWRVTLVYFSGVVAGSLATSVFDPTTRLVGASGGVYALLTAHVASVIMNWSEMSSPLLNILVIAILVFATMANSVYNRFLLKIDDQVACTAHIGGIIAGLLVGIYILKNLNPKTFENYIWWVALVLFIILVLAAILCNIFMSHWYPDV